MAFIKPTGLALSSKEHLLPLGRQIDLRLLQMGLGRYSVNPTPGIVQVAEPQRRDARGRFIHTAHRPYPLEPVTDAIRALSAANDDEPLQPDIFTGSVPAVVVKKRTSKTRRPKGK